MSERRQEEGIMALVNMNLVMWFNSKLRKGSYSRIFQYSASFCSLLASQVFVERNYAVNLTDEGRGKVIQIESMGKKIREKKQKILRKDLLLKGVLRMNFFFFIIHESYYFHSTRPRRDISFKLDIPGTQHPFSDTRVVQIKLRDIIPIAIVR